LYIDLSPSTTSTPRTFYNTIHDLLSILAEPFVWIDANEGVEQNLVGPTEIKEFNGVKNDYRASFLIFENNLRI
jgi:hypothetical protein